MRHLITRRGLPAILAGAAVVATSPEARAVDPVQEPERDYPAPKFTPRARKPKLGPTFVQDFVIFAHYDLDLVKRLYEKDPTILNATVDWGGGDWESALGGASHIGRRDIAEFLLEKGARIDIFAAAMLGHLDAVKSVLAARPALIDARGPHGIPLLAHAKAGGEQAAEVFRYLESLKKPT